MSMDEKDIVGARINLDTSKILASFKVIDEGVRKNAESFKVLNTELTITSKNYADLSKAADKLVMSADDRRKKIQAESDALVSQRSAQTEYIKAKTDALNTANQVTDSKLAAQLALQKKREDQIEQQEREHQAKMVDLMQKASKSASDAATAQARLNNMGSMDNLSHGTDSLMDMASKAALHATVFMGVYSVINTAQEALKEGLVDIESKMAGYVQTNEQYFMDYNAQTHEATLNTQKLNEQTAQFLQTAHDLGADINDVTESARLWGRMYKDVGIVQEQVNASTKLSTIDLVSLQDATKGMESTLAQYNVQIKNTSDAQLQSGRIVDSWSSVAHNTMAPVSELTAGFERTGKVADQVGVSFDFMNGLMASGIRNTALGGANLGNMWKTVLGNMRTDKAVAEIESLGVATKQVVNGTEQWRKAEDILLDLSVKVIDKNYDLTKSYEDISRGVYQYAKLAASLNVGDIILGESASINSTGTTMEYLKTQMDTIQRKAAETKASLLSIFNEAGNDGLRTAIKGALDVIDQILIGLSKLPKGTFTAVASVTALVVAYKTIVQPLMLWKTAQEALTVAMQINTTVTTEQTVAMVAQTAVARNAAAMTALATGGITLLTGAIAASLFMMGSHAKKQQELNDQRSREITVMEQQYQQYQKQADFLPKLVQVHNELQKQMESGTLSADKQTQVKTDLDKVSRALTDTIGKEGLAQLTAAGYTDQATQQIIESLNARKQALKEDILNSLTNQGTQLDQQIKDKEAKLSKMIDPERLPGFERQGQQNKIDSAKADLDNLKKQRQDLKGQQLQVEEDLAILTMQGQEGAAQKAQDDYDNRKKDFQSQMDQFQHLVNMKADGYKTADEQLDKLKSIRSRFSDLHSDDLYTIDEDIFRTGQGKEINAKGFSTAGNSFKFPLDAIDNQSKTAKALVDSATSIIDFYNAKKDALGGTIDDTAQKVELYTNKQNQLHAANEILRGSVSDLQDKQSSLNDLYAKGKITLDDYNQYSGEVASRIDSLTKEIDGNSTAWYNEAKAIKDAKDQQLQASYDFSSNWIAHQKAMGDLSAQQEYDAWQRVDARYVAGTQLRQKADEQVHSAKMALIQEEQSAADKMLSAEKDRINQAKQAFDDAQNAKIKAIDQEIQKMDQTNSDADYASKLAEKQAREKVLEAGVGPEAKAELAQTQKDIAQMTLEHSRELDKRSLEQKKQGLQDQKDTQDKAYDDLVTALDKFQGDSNKIELAIKDFRVKTNQDANSQILKDLDSFVSQYKSKMASIATLNQSQEQNDLAAYNQNIGGYYAAKINGDTKKMTNYSDANAKIRQKYGITNDSGPLTSLKNGGIGLDASQKAVFDKILPIIKKPSTLINGIKSVINQFFNFDNSISGGVNLNGGNGVAGLYDQRTGLINRQRALGGDKIR